MLRYCVNDEQEILRLQIDYDLSVYDVCLSVYIVKPLHKMARIVKHEINMNNCLNNESNALRTEIPSFSTNSASDHCKSEKHTISLDCSDWNSAALKPDFARTPYAWVHFFFFVTALIYDIRKQENTRKHFHSKCDIVYVIIGIRRTWLCDEAASFLRLMLLSYVSVRLSAIKYEHQIAFGMYNDCTGAV